MSGKTTERLDPAAPIQGSAPDEEAAPAQGLVERLVRDDVDRKRFLKAVGAGGAASFGAFVLAACGSSKKAATTAGSASTSTAAAGAGASSESSGSGGGDVAIANYALTLEYLETEFYEKVVASHLFSGKVASVIKSFGEQEQTHVEALHGAVQKLGGKPAAKPEGKFPVMSAKQVGELAYTVENLGAAAYLGQAAKIQNPELLAAALSIHSVEARHAATLGTVIEKPITPDGAFAKPADMATVLKAVKPFLA